MSKNLIRHLVEILVAVVEESSSIPSGVLDCIVGQFETYGMVSWTSRRLEADLSQKPDSPSFQLIVDVCNRTPSKFQRPIFAVSPQIETYLPSLNAEQHFSEIQIAHGRSTATADPKVLSDSHDLLLSMYRYSPALLLNVVPLLEENLKAADEAGLRQLSTKTLGTMFGERPAVGTSVADLAKAYPSTWRAWLGRKVDKAVIVRLAWVEASRGILVNHPELHKALEGESHVSVSLIDDALVELVDRIHDSEEKVRAAICKVIGSLDYETALHHVSQPTLRAVGGRMSDKKVRGYLD